MQAPEGQNVTADRSMVLVGKVESIPDCNIVAMIHEFPTVRVYRANSLTYTVDQFEPPIAAILVDERSLSRTERIEKILDNYGRERSVAVIVESAESMSEATEALLLGHLVHSILPMNLRLETWLLAVRLLLIGDEFTPPPLGRSHLRRSGRRTDQERGRLTVGAALAHLTDRGLQMLHFLASGSSDRHIASQFRLSEHTAKMCVHNLTRKMNAPNRTVAATVTLKARQSRAPNTKFFTFTAKRSYNDPATSA